MNANWDTLIDETALAGLIPSEYSHFAVPVKDSLVAFLGGLPPAVQEQILADQLSLPPSANFSRRLTRLAQCCPVLHKLGQVMARDQRLAPELRIELRTLESMPPRFDLDTIRAILVRELGDLEFRSLQLLPPAIAEASVAVVIPFTDLSRPDQPEGVFKILKPGIDERLHLELDLLAKVGALLDDRSHELGIPQLDYRETFEQVRTKLSHELQLDKEQDHLRTAARLYADQSEIQIPRVLDHCTSCVTAMERIYGEKVTEHRFDTPAASRALAVRLARAMIAQPIFSHQERALFHCDPHAGNFIAANDGRLGILDWSLVGHLGELERAMLVQVLLGAITLRGEKITAVLKSLDNRGRCDLFELRSCVERWLARMRQGQFPGLTWLTGLLDEATQVSRLSMSSDMVMFRKSLLTLTGVLHEVGACEFHLDRVVLGEFLRSYVQEWPSRWLVSPLSRSFGTRLSNFDIAETLLNLPSAACRYWQAIWRDTLAMRNLSSVCL